MNPPSTFQFAPVMYAGSAAGEIADHTGHFAWLTVAADRHHFPCSESANSPTSGFMSVATGPG